MCLVFDILTHTVLGIVSITDEGRENILLIRQPRYPPGMYSCVAGFVDSGESLEV